MRKRYSLIIMTLIILIGIGYATLSANLSITGLNVFKGNTWDVHFENVTDKSINTAKDFTTGTISQDAKSISFDVTLTTPGESYTFFTDIVNGGSLDAMLDSYEIEGIPEELENTIELNVTYLDGVELNQYDLLRKNTRETIKVEVLYKHGDQIEISDLPDVDYNFTMTLSINYLQSDNNALARQNQESDTIAPVLVKLDTIQDKNTITLNVDAYDEYSGISKYYFSKDGENYIASENPNYTFSELEKDEYEVSVYIEDLSGNKSAIESTTIMVSPIYAVLYTDGTLVFNESGNIRQDKTVSYNYGNISRSDYSSGMPWSAYNIQVVDFEEKITPNSTHSWFSAASNMTNILNIENLDTSYVTDMSYMFNKCKKLTSLDLTSFDTSKVTNMEYMFAENSSLTSLDVSHFDTSKVTNMNRMFTENPSLTSLDVSHFDTSRVTNLEYTFSYDSSLTYLDVSKWNLSNVTNLYGTFRECSGLQTLDVSKWNTSKVTNMALLFYKDKSLSNLDVSNWDVSNVTTMSSVFLGTSNFTAIDVSKWNTSKVTDMSDMFYNNKNLTSLDVSNFDTSNVTSMNSMFSYVSGLTTLDVSNWDTSKVTDMCGMFSGTSNLVSLDISKWDTKNVTTMQQMFSGATSLTTLNISTLNTSNVSNMYGLFNDCYKLEGLDLSQWDSRKVTDYRKIFSNTSKDATSKVWYYGRNTENLYNNLSVSSNVYVTFTRK